MQIGVPREIKQDEYRVGMIPAGMEELTRAGHRVVIETGAGLGSGITDKHYTEAGAQIAASAAVVYGQADLIVKVKEPQAKEWPLLRSGQMVFTYFHFAASEDLTRNVLATGITAIAYETLRGRKGDLPCLTPMSEIAGRMSIQEGAKYLERPQLGRGILLAGVPGVAPAHICILGGGVVGKNAARIAAGFQADVVILDINVDRLRYLEDIMPPNVNTLYSDRHNVREQLCLADLVIGAVLIEGARTPRLVSRADLALMKPGAVIIGRRRRSGWVHRDVEADDAFRTNLRGGWHRPLLRHEHARGRRPDQHLRPLQRHAAVRPRTGEPGPRRTGGDRSRLCPCDQSARRRGDQPDRRGDIRLALQPLRQITPLESGPLIGTLTSRGSTSGASAINCWRPVPNPPTCYSLGRHLSTSVLSSTRPAQ